MISVVVPIDKLTPYLDIIREQFTLVNTPIEVIFVINKDLKGIVDQEKPYEKVVIAKRRGRGFSCVQGVSEAEGEIVVFLHADTILPKGWDIAISNALLQKHVIGGAFSLTFDDQRRYLKLLIFLSNLLFRLTGELWGDRAIFVRSEYLKDCLTIMNVPIMEDVRLSHCMKKKGDVIMLKEKVTTSATTFTSRGLLRNTLRILKCRLWYALGGNLEEIHGYYYSK